MTDSTGRRASLGERGEPVPDDATEDESFSGEIRVAARVIDFLSSGLYQNAAACLKELINNSYDADATEVTVSVKPDADLIVVEDNGHGMTRTDFVTHFENVAESRKRDSGEFTEWQERLKIGKIGIGFIAANELCDEMEIFSTMKGSSELLHVKIDFGEIRDRAYAERVEADTGRVKKGDYEGETLPADPEEHYTQVFLKRIRERAREEFVRDTITSGEDTAPTIYGKRPETVTKMLSRLDSWGSLDLYSQTRLNVGLSVPVEYLPNWAPDEYQAQLESFTRRAKALNFSVTYDGTPLLKPTVLTDAGKDSLLRVVEHRGEYVNVTGYMFARHGTYKPRELNGILVRIREATVGGYDSTWMGYPAQLQPLFKDWCTVELHVDRTETNPSKDLDSALNIERRTLRETHPATVELQEWFYGEFAEFLSAARAELYTRPNKKKSQERVNRQRTRLDKLAGEASKSLGAEASKTISEAFSKHGRSTEATLPGTEPAAEPDPKALLREYDALAVYEAVVAAAAEVLPREQAQAFLKALVRRLS